MNKLTTCLFLILSATLFAGEYVQESPSGITHSLLATGGKTYILQADKENPNGKVVWTYPASTREGWVLPDGNVLLAVSRGGKFPGGGAVEVKRDNTVVWEYKGTQDEVNSIQKTAEGTYVLTEAGKNPRLLEIDASGKTVVEFPLDCQKTNAHMETRMARKLADGTYLCPHLLDFAVKQYDKTGKVLKVINTKLDGDPEGKTHTWPFTAIRLANGNTLCGLTHANRVAEFDADGKKVWELTNEEVGGIIKDACGIQRLPNGNTIVNSYAAGPNQVRLFEVTPDKKIVWSFKSADKPGIHHFHVIDTNGTPLEGTALR
ncbi:MAG TPA: hypothetical protein VEK08_24365 [Planctomycetota bacterium]|nr:hypothetical protein [Planctomycetota bacterium]